MNIKIITLVFLGTFASCLHASKSLLDYEEPMTQFVGEMIFNHSIDPDLCLFYKGSMLQIDNNHDKQIRKIGQTTPQHQLVKIVPYMLKEAKATKEIYILVCNRPQCSSEINTVMYYHIPENVSYKLYKLTATRTYDDNGEATGCTWAVAEEALFDDRIVPDNTIIFLFNADYVDGLDVKSWPVNSNIRLLPTIIMKKSIDADAVARAIIEARLLGIDFNTVHYHYAKDEKKRESKTVVTIKAA